MPLTIGRCIEHHGRPRGLPLMAMMMMLMDKMRDGGGGVRFVVVEIVVGREVAMSVVVVGVLFVTGQYPAALVSVGIVPTVGTAVVFIVGLDPTGGAAILC